MNKKNRKIFSDMVIKHDSTWVSIDAMIVWIDQLTNSAYDVCADIALALDSNRGNEKEIAKAIRDSKEQL